MRATVNGSAIRRKARAGGFGGVMKSGSMASFREAAELPDNEPEEPRRTTTVHSRYHVGTPHDGTLLEAFARRAHAFEEACRHANKNGVTVTVFDSMARQGASQLWEFYPSPDGGVVTWKTATARRPWSGCQCPKCPVCREAGCSPTSACKAGS